MKDLKSGFKNNILLNNLDSFYLTCGKLIKNDNYFGDKTITVSIVVRNHENKDFYIKPINLYYSFEKNDFVFNQIPGDTIIIQEIKLDSYPEFNIIDFLDQSIDFKNKKSHFNIEFDLSKIMPYLKKGIEEFVDFINCAIVRNKEPYYVLSTYIDNKGISTIEITPIEVSYDYINPCYLDGTLNDFIRGELSLQCFSLPEKDLFDLLSINFEFFFEKEYFSRTDISSLLLYCLQNNLSEINLDIITNILGKSELFNNYKKYIFILSYFINSFLKLRNKTITDIIDYTKVDSSGEINSKQQYLFSRQFDFFQKINNQFIIWTNIQKDYVNKEELYNSLLLSSYYNMKNNMKKDIIYKKPIIFIEKSIDYQPSSKKGDEDEYVYYSKDSIAGSFVSCKYYYNISEFSKSDLKGLSDKNIDLKKIKEASLNQIYLLLKKISQFNCVETNRRLLKIPYLFGIDPVCDKNNTIRFGILNDLFFKTYPFIDYGGLLIDNELIYNRDRLVELINNNNCNQRLILSNFGDIVNLYKVRFFEPVPETLEEPFEEFIIFLIDSIKSELIDKNKAKNLYLPFIYPCENVFIKLLEKEIESQNIIENHKENFYRDCSNVLNKQSDENNKSSSVYLDKLKSLSKNISILIDLLNDQ